jgi:hypothetical protein
VFVKKRETSLPRSAIRAICSTEVGFPGLRVLFIKLLLTVAVFPHFKNNGIKLTTNPPNHTLLLWSFEPLIEVERMLKYLLSFFESDSTSGVGPQPFALSRVETESHVV